MPSTLDQLYGQDWETRARQTLEEAAERLGCTVDKFSEGAQDILDHRINNYPQLEAQLNKALAANADLMETIRGLRLDIDTYKSTLEGLQRRVDKFQRLGFGDI